MRAYLKSAGDRDVTLIMFPHADHLLEASSDGWNGYDPEHFVPGYPDVMIDGCVNAGLSPSSLGRDRAEASV